jgi:hypothetical protein
MAYDKEKGNPLDVTAVAGALVELCQITDVDKRYDLAKALLEISGPLKFNGEPWLSPLNHPLLFAMSAKDARLIQLFHDNGANLRKDDATSVGIQLGDGFWCLPELIFPDMKDQADLYGFVYQIMDRRKSSPQDMEDTIRTIHDFAQWANADNLPARITEATSTWQAKRGNGFLWITGQRDYQLQTLAALINIGLDIEQPIQHVKMNNAENQEERRGMYREAVAYALASSTQPATKQHKSPRL